MSPLFRQGVGGRALDPDAVAEFKFWLYVRNQKGTLERVSSMTGWRDKRAINNPGYAEKFFEDLAGSRGLVGVVRCPHCRLSVQACEMVWHLCSAFAVDVVAVSIFRKIDDARLSGKPGIRLVLALKRMLKDSLEKEAYRLWCEESGMWPFFFDEGLTDEDCFEKYRLYKWAGFLSLLRPAEVEWPPDSAELKRVERFWERYSRGLDDGEQRILFRLFNPRKSVEGVFRKPGQGLSQKDYGIVLDTRELGPKEAAEVMEKGGFKGFDPRSPVKMYEHFPRSFSARRSEWNEEAEEYSSLESGPL